MDNKFKATYPGYFQRAFTMSYDDGTVQDVRVMEMCRQYGMGCTFAPNTSCLDGTFWYWDHLGHIVYTERCPADRLKFRYEGFEIAGHTHTHPSLRDVPDEGFEVEVGSCQKKLTELVGYQVRGMTYPNNGYDDRVCENLKKYGVVYSRTTDATYGFEVPEDFLRWHPTCHDHDERVLELADECIKNHDGKLKIFYVWGHAYEFDKPDAHCKEGGQRWLDFRILLKKVADSGAFWCVSNIEIYDYIMAVRGLSYGDGFIENPSDLDVYGYLGDEKVVIKAKGRIQVK